MIANRMMYFTSLLPCIVWTRWIIQLLVRTTLQGFTLMVGGWRLAWHPIPRLIYGNWESPSKALRQDSHFPSI
uniref:Uncharacterized protein n=1 Tax=Rhizophora mucronata TaxID=61149 RepID=A0A2P2MYV2_RHIMU